MNKILLSVPDKKLPFFLQLIENLNGILIVDVQNDEDNQIQKVEKTETYDDRLKELKDQIEKMR
jgi:hypothetical protein